MTTKKTATKANKREAKAAEKAKVKKTEKTKSASKGTYTAQKCSVFTYLLSDVIFKYFLT
jgi:hypothetical protein